MFTSAKFTSMQCQVSAVIRLYLFIQNEQLFLQWRLMKILFLVEDEGEEGGLLKKQTNERSVNGNPDYGEKEIKDTENGKNKILLVFFMLLGTVILFLISSAYYFRKRKIFEKNKQK